MKMKFEYLNPEQVDFIANGCGGKGGWIKPPNFIFFASCKHHDFRYWRGNTEAQRKEDDELFYSWMKIDIALMKLYEEDMTWRERAVSILKVSVKKVHYKIWAWTYYKVVRIGGRKYYYYAEQMKNIADLHREMEGRK